MGMFLCRSEQINVRSMSKILDNDNLRASHVENVHWLAMFRGFHVKHWQACGIANTEAGRMHHID